MRTARSRRLAGPMMGTVALLLAGCSAGPPAAERDAAQAPPAVVTGREIDLAGGTALLWGEGAYGVVLAHGPSYDAGSWEAQAVLIAAQGATVIAVEEVTPTAVRSAVRRLRGRGVRDVALVGAGTGADAILRVAQDAPALPDQLVLFSPSVLLEPLGEEPKLFVASAGEPGVDVARALAATSGGEDNEELVLPGSAEGQAVFEGDQGEQATRALLDRLERFAGS